LLVLLMLVLLAWLVLLACLVLLAWRVLLVLLMLLAWLVLEESKGLQGLQGVTRMAYSPRLWLMAIGW
jgi:hypothetical protein